MKNISRFFEHIYSFLIPFFLSTSLTIAFSNICEIGISTNTILVAGLIISSLFMFYKIDVTRMVILVMLGLFVLTVVMVLIFDGQLIINEASSFIYYCTSTNIAYDRGYARLIGILVVFVINAVLFISDWVYILRAIIAVGLFGGAVTLTVFNINIPKYAIFSLVIYILSIAIETSNVINNRKIKSKEVKIYSTNLLPICLACAIIIIIIPTSEKPINWQPVINLYQTVVDRAENFFNKKDLNVDDYGNFNPFKTGYSDTEQKLGGRIKDDNAEMMRLVLSSPIEKRTLYLRGSVSNEYTGSMWKKTYAPSGLNAKEYSFEALEMFNALYIASNLNMDGFRYSVNVCDAKVYPTGISTKTVFYPSLASGFYDNSDQPLKFNDANENLRFNSEYDKNSYYDINYFALNNDNLLKYMLSYREMFKVFNKDFHVWTIPLLYNNFNQINNIKVDYFSSQAIDSPDYTMGTEYDYKAAVRDRSQYIYNSYNHLPNTVTDRTKKLVKDITNGCTSDYEKLEAIKNYLKKNYTYTKSPPKTPAGQDFVDYFLFDSKKGYCTYFATSMAVMARCVGIPTRYVEGINCSADSYDSEQNAYIIRNNNAHAWSEAYFEGIGWITYDATPGYGDNQLSNNDNLNSNNTSSGDPTNNNNGNINNNNTDDSTIVSSEKTIKEIKPYHVLIIILIVFVSIGIVIASIWMYIYIIKRRYIRRYDRLDNRGKYLYTFRNIIYYLNKLGYNKKASETIRDFAQKVGSRFSSEHLCFEAVEEIFARVRYGESDVSNDEILLANEYKNRLEQYIIARYGKLRAKIILFIFKKKK